MLICKMKGFLIVGKPFFCYTWYMSDNVEEK
jgi:hypothetical protein